MRILQRWCDHDIGIVLGSPFHLQAARASPLAGERNLWSRHLAVAAGLAVVAVLLLCVWAVIELRGTTPLIDVRAVRHPAVAGANLAMSSAGSACTSCKENHIAAAGVVTTAIDAVWRSMARTGQKVETDVEVQNVTQAVEALDAGARWIMLDNLPVADIEVVVHIRAERADASRILLEASGTVHLDSVRAIAKTPRLHERTAGALLLRIRRLHRRGSPLRFHRCGSPLRSAPSPQDGHDQRRHEVDGPFPLVEAQGVIIARDDGDLHDLDTRPGETRAHGLDKGLPDSGAASLVIDHEGFQDADLVPPLP
ncbi:hypothetical protein PWE32_35515 [Streptomyces neyagawaensis]|nr:hypothetical protein [Streptomyces neyagawaensis]MCL6735168.1 hypothetical protein [Streptomyces neyagawaensis]MDE1687563.1 hypothetical protein [Streptomyces neyagawaensis]